MLGSRAATVPERNWLGNTLGTRAPRFTKTHPGKHFASLLGVSLSEKVDKLRLTLAIPPSKC